MERLEKIRHTDGNGIHGPEIYLELILMLPLP